MNSVGKLATMGLVGGTVAGASLVQPKTKNGENLANKFNTALNLGALTATPFLVKELIKANPRTSVKVAQKAGSLIEKGIEYVTKLAKGDTAKKVVSYVKNVLEKVKGTKIGGKVVEKIGSVVKNIASNASVQKVVTKATQALEKFVQSPTTKKGKIGLIAAGVALLAYAGIKTITKFFKKEGAIDQKYDDLHKQYERMVAIHPIMNAQTGEPISFEDYCKYAQTFVK
jgi:hypothetical protein